MERGEMDMERVPENQAEQTNELEQLVERVREKFPDGSKLPDFAKNVQSWAEWQLKSLVEYHSPHLAAAEARKGQVARANSYRDTEGQIWEMSGDGYRLES